MRWGYNEVCSTEVEAAIDGCTRRLKEIDAALEKWKVMAWALGHVFSMLLCAGHREREPGSHQ